ncbi:MAG: hypothetical protein O7D35_00655 [Acidobacteria bacterium]|nr:hypothetical protein [Acidobacteriota bacterium]
MKPARLMPLSFLLAAALALPCASFGQEILDAEQPDPGFRVLGPRTVVSFVRQSLPEPVGTDEELTVPRWNTILHLSNTGNRPIAAAAVFVSSDGAIRRALRLVGIAPGQTRTFSVARIIGADTFELGEVATGIVLLRYFAPTLDEDDDTRRFFSQMVSAETIQVLPGLAPQVLRLDVEQPQVLAGRERRRR